MKIRLTSNSAFRHVSICSACDKCALLSCRPAVLLLLLLLLSQASIIFTPRQQHHQLYSSFLSRPSVVLALPVAPQPCSSLARIHAPSRIRFSTRHLAQSYHPPS